MTRAGAFGSGRRELVFNSTAKGKGPSGKVVEILGDTSYEVDYLLSAPVSCAHVVATTVGAFDERKHFTAGKRGLISGLLSGLYQDQSYALVHHLGRDTYEESYPPPSISRARGAGSSGDSSVPDDDALREKFERLKTAWRLKSAKMSVVADKVLIPEYQQIIGLGKPAVPLIIESLRTEGGHWFWALVMITGEDPAADATTVQEARERWVAWYDASLASNAR